MLSLTRLRQARGLGALYAQCIGKKFEPYIFKALKIRPKKTYNNLHCKAQKINLHRAVYAKACMERDKTDKEPKKPPIHYTVYHPNVLIGANNEMRLAEIRLYTEILNFNHQDEPDRLIYQIPYEYITQSDRRQASKNAVREFMRIASTLQKRVFTLNREFMQEHFNKNFPSTIVPFPTINYKDTCFEMELHPYFKKMLTKLELGFTKGDIEFLRTLKHEYSLRLYWLIRSEQWKVGGNSLRMELEILKDALGCADQYKNAFDNFKRRVIEPVQNEFRGSWVEFNYETVRGGRGGKVVKEIVFNFKNDLEQAKQLQLGLRYPWEDTLLQYGINERDIVRLRHNVTQQAPLKDGYLWNNYYVVACVAIAQEHYRERRANPHAEKIKSMRSYLFKALTEGWWIEEVERRRLRDEAVRPVSIPMPAAQTGSPPAPLARKVEKRTRSVRIPYDEFKETYREYLKASGEIITEEDFASRFGYALKEGYVEKVHTA